MGLPPGPWRRSVCLGAHGRRERKVRRKRCWRNCFQGVKWNDRCAWKANYCAQIAFAYPECPTTRPARHFSMSTIGLLKDDRLSGQTAMQVTVRSLSPFTGATDVSDVLRQTNLVETVNVNPTCARLSLLSMPANNFLSFFGFQGGTPISWARFR